MEIQVLKGEIQDAKDEAIVVNLFEGVKAPGGATAAVDQKINKSITKLIATGDFTGKKNQVAVLYPPDGFPAKRVFVVGLGKKEKFNLDVIRQAAGSVCQKAQQLNVKSYTTIVHGAGAGRISPDDAAQALVEGTLLANYRFDRYHTETDSRPQPVQKVTLLERDGRNIVRMKKGAAIGEIISWAQCLARDLSNEPGNVLTPTKLAETAADLGKKYGFKTQILRKAEIEKLKFGALLGVARGSAEPPTFTVMEYQPSKRAFGPIVLVGKGVTFDSGGISIKPADNMDEMKGDMTGGAVVIATITAAARLQLPVHLIGLVPSTENLPSGTSYKPGDVLRSYLGKTIEIINTDAEGRLILADALAYAQTFKPKAVIDVATLTGAVKIALGTVAAGLLASDQKLANRLKAAADKSAEKVWQLPLWEEYQERIKSDIADVKNSGGRPGSTITAACFLQKFVGDSPWAHLDIAAMDIEEKGQPYVPKGGTGFGCRLLLQLLRDWGRG